MHKYGLRVISPMQNFKERGKLERCYAVEFCPGAEDVSISDGGTTESPDRSIGADGFSVLLRSGRATFAETELVDIVPNSSQELVCYNGKYTKSRYLRIEGVTAGRDSHPETLYIWDSKNQSKSFSFLSEALSASIRGHHFSEIRAVAEQSRNLYTITYKNHHIASYDKPSMVLYVTESSFRIAQGISPSSSTLDEFFGLGLPPSAAKERYKHQ